MGVISHKRAYCAKAGSTLEVIAGQNQWWLPLGSVSLSINNTRDDGGQLLHANTTAIDNWERKRERA